jgi:hypothetical protein
VHPVNAAVLAQGGGRYRCGKCHKTGNALEALFDEWPQARQQGAPAGDLPELGLALSLGPGEEPQAQTTSEETDLPRRRPLLRAVWIIAAVVLTVIITLNLARFLQQPLIDTPWLHSTLVRLGVRQAPPQAPFRALDQIKLLSRELKAHPFRPGVLLLTATIVNRAAASQAYPDIDVTLLDIHNRQLARQLFKPADYLPNGSDLRNGMTPQAYLTLSLEMPDPGDGAVGFELQFR